MKGKVIYQQRVQFWGILNKTQYTKGPTVTSGGPMKSSYNHPVGVCDPRFKNNLSTPRKMPVFNSFTLPEIGLLGMKE